MATAMSDHLPAAMKPLVNIVLVVGPQKVRLNAVREVLEESSTALKAILPTHPRQTLELPDEQPEVIQTILAVLHDADRELHTNLHNWTVVELLSLAHSTRKFGVVDRLAPLIWSEFREHDLRDCEPEDTARALFIACTFDDYPEIWSLLTDLIMRLKIDDEGGWSLYGTSSSYLGTPKFLTFGTESNHAEEGRVPILDVGLCCGEMIAFIMQQSVQARELIWLFGKLLAKKLQDNGFSNRSLDKTETATGALYILGVQENIQRFEAASSEGSNSADLLDLSPLQLFFKIFRVSALSWPNTVHRSINEQERVNSHLGCEFWSLIEYLQAGIEESYTSGWKIGIWQPVMQQFERHFNTDLPWEDSCT